MELIHHPYPTPESCRFRAQVGQELEATVTLEQLSGSRASFSTVCKNLEGRVVVDGLALALIPPDEEKS